MKKLLSFLSCVLVLMLAGCTSEEVRVENPEQGLSSHLRTADEAVAIAQNLYQARHNSRANVAVANVAVIGSSASRASADTLIYAVNFADNQGFTLVSAAKSGIDIIGYTDNGNFDLDQVASNECFSFYLDAATDYVNSEIRIPGGAIGGPIGGDLIKFPTRPDTFLVLAAPRIPVDYGQTFPEGNLYSNRMAGCVQTACAMVLAYLEQPAKMTYTDPSITLTSETLNWASIKKHVKSLNSIVFSDIYDHYNECSATSAEHEVLSRICKELGHRNNADPQFGGTGATLSAARTTMKNLVSGYVSDIKNLEAPYTDLLDQLKGSKSVGIIGGTSDDGISHAWICDGGDGRLVRSKVMLATGEEEIIEEKTYYYYYKWGNCGQDDGYFYAGVFDPKKPSRADYRNDIIYFTIGK